MGLADMEAQEMTDPFAPWGFVGYINMKRWFDPAEIPDTPGDLAVRAVQADPEFHTLPQAERDRRVREAMEGASWDDSTLGN